MSSVDKSINKLQKFRTVDINVVESKERNNEKWARMVQNGESDKKLYKLQTKMGHNWPKDSEEW